MSVGLAGQASARTLKQKLLSGGAWTAGTRVAAGFSGFAVNALLARLLVPADLGDYFLLVSVASAGALSAQLGLQVALVRLVAEAMSRGRADQAYGAAATGLAIVAVAAAVLGSVVAVFGADMAVAIFGSATLARIAWLGGLWLGTLAIMNLIAEVFRGLHDYRMAGLIGGAGSSLLLLAMIGSLYVMRGQASVGIAAALGVLATAAVAIAGAVALRRRASQAAVRVAMPVREMLSVSLPLLVTSIAFFVSGQADLWILGIWGSREDVAVYGAAVRLVQLVMVPMLMINAVLAPLIADLHAKGHGSELQKLLRGAAAVSGLPALVMLACVFGGAAPLLGWLYGDFYRHGTTALVLICSGQAVNVLTGPAAVTLMMTGHQRAVMTIAVLAGAGLVFGGPMAAGLWGINGVAAVAALMTASGAAAALVCVRRRIGVWTHFSPMGVKEALGVLFTLRRWRG